MSTKVCANLAYFGRKLRIVRECGVKLLEVPFDKY
jgi:hypothetical protein